MCSFSAGSATLHPRLLIARPPWGRSGGDDAGREDGCPLRRDAIHRVSPARGKAPPRHPTPAPGHPGGDGRRDGVAPVAAPRGAPPRPPPSPPRFCIFRPVYTFCTPSPQGAFGAVCRAVWPACPTERGAYCGAGRKHKCKVMQEISTEYCKARMAKRRCSITDS